MVYWRPLPVKPDVCAESASTSASARQLHRDNPPVPDVSGEKDERYVVEHSPIDVWRRKSAMAIAQQSRKRGHLVSVALWTPVPTLSDMFCI